MNNKLRNIYGVKTSEPQAPDLTKLCVPGCNLSFKKLEGADLHNKDLTGANLSRTNLHNANLSDANLTKASFFLTNLEGTTLTGAKFSEFEPNYPLKSDKNSHHTHAIFFSSPDNIETQLNRLNEQTNLHPTLKPMIAHSLVTLLAKAPTESGLATFIESKDHAFFDGFDWAAQTPSLLRGLVQDTARGMSSAPLTPSTLKLCAYFLIRMPKLSAEQSDLLYFFSVKEQKNALIQAISTDDQLKSLLNPKKLKESTCALTQILNTRRHLFHTERKPNETASSKQLFSLFSQQSSLGLSGNNETGNIRLVPTKR